MPSRLEIADVSCPGSTPVSAPVEVQLNFPGGILRRFHVVIPDGHSGLTGIALGYAHTPVIPYKQPAFISGNAEHLVMDWADKQPGVPWAVFMCNLDLIAHAWEVRFEYDELGAPLSVTPDAPIAPDDILSAGASAMQQQPAADGPAVGGVGFNTAVQHGR